MKKPVTRDDVKNTMIKLCEIQPEFYNNDVRNHGKYSETEVPTSMINLVASELERKGKLKIESKGNRNCYVSKTRKSI